MAMDHLICVRRRLLTRTRSPIRAQNMGTIPTTLLPTSAPCPHIHPYQRQVLRLKQARARHSHWYTTQLINSTTIQTRLMDTPSTWMCHKPGNMRCIHRWKVGTLITRCLQSYSVAPGLHSLTWSLLIVLAPTFDSVLGIGLPTLFHTWFIMMMTIDTTLTAFSFCCFGPFLAPLLYKPPTHQLVFAFTTHPHVHICINLSLPKSIHLHSSLIFIRHCPFLWLLDYNNNGTYT